MPLSTSWLVKSNDFLAIGSESLSDAQEDKVDVHVDVISMSMSMSCPVMFNHVYQLFLPIGSDSSSDPHEGVDESNGSNGFAEQLSVSFSDETTIERIMITQ